MGNVKTKTQTAHQIQKCQNLKKFLKDFGLELKDFAIIFGISIQGARYWNSGEREIPEHVNKLINLFRRQPHLVNEFF